MTSREGLWSRVDKSLGNSSCWPWLGGTSGDGYGAVNVGGKQVGAHRVAWTLTHGAIPKGASVLHRCDNPICCNPGHLFLGTTADNMADKVAKGRQCRGETHGRAKLREADVLQMRSMYASGGTSYPRLASAFGVSIATAHRAVLGISWRLVR